MATRDELLTHLWREAIDPNLQQGALQNMVENCKRDPGAPFGYMGAVIERLVAAGAAPTDLGLLMRSAAYDAVFQTLYALDDPGLDHGDDLNSLYESLLMADPSGTEGRSPPGAPLPTT